jgi:hypothetical protein
MSPPGWHCGRKHKNWQSQSRRHNKVPYANVWQMHRKKQIKPNCQTPYTPTPTCFGACIQSSIQPRAAVGCATVQPMISSRQTTVFNARHPTPEHLRKAAVPTPCSRVAEQIYGENFKQGRHIRSTGCTVLTSKHNTDLSVCRGAETCMHTPVNGHCRQVTPKQHPSDCQHSHMQGGGLPRLLHMHMKC